MCTCPQSRRARWNTLRGHRLWISCRIIPVSGPVYLNLHNLYPSTRVSTTLHTTQFIVVIISNHVSIFYWPTAAPGDVVAMRSISPGVWPRGAQADLTTGRISTISTWTCRRRLADSDSLRPASDGSQLEAERPSLLIRQTSPAHSGAERRRATKSRFCSVRVALSSSMVSHKRYAFKYTLSQLAQY